MTNTDVHQTRIRFCSRDRPYKETSSHTLSVLHIILFTAAFNNPDLTIKILQIVYTLIDNGYHLWLAQEVFSRKTCGSFNSTKPPCLPQLMRVQGIVHDRLISRIPFTFYLCIIYTNNYNPTMLTAN